MITKEKIELLGLDEALKLQYRQTGRSTRQVDNYIQRLFEDGIINVTDHTEAEFGIKDGTKGSILLWARIIERLHREHPGVKIYLHTLKKSISLKAIDGYYLHDGSDNHKSAAFKDGLSIGDTIRELFKELSNENSSNENSSFPGYTGNGYTGNPIKFFESICKTFQR